MGVTDLGEKRVTDTLYLIVLFEFAHKIHPDPAPMGAIRRWL
jgi:hypothetical protein